MTRLGSARDDASTLFAGWRFSLPSSSPLTPGTLQEAMKNACPSNVNRDERRVNCVLPPPDARHSDVLVTAPQTPSPSPSLSRFVHGRPCRDITILTMASMTQPLALEHDLLRLSDVLQMIPVSESAWRAGVKSGKYPKPHEHSAGLPLWLRAEIEEYITAQDGHHLAVSPRTIWAAYAAAFLSRYGTHPIRNAKVNSQLLQLAYLLGDEAPSVAEFYVGHDDPFYIQTCHSVGPLLKNASALRTQWKTGRKIGVPKTESVYQRAARQRIAEFTGGLAMAPDPSLTPTSVGKSANGQLKFE